MHETDAAFYIKVLWVKIFILYLPGFEVGSVEYSGEEGGF